MKFRKKPVVIEAVQYDGIHTGNIIDFIGSNLFEPLNGKPFIKTLS